MTAEKESKKITSEDQNCNEVTERRGGGGKTDEETERHSDTDRLTDTDRYTIRQIDDKGRQIRGVGMRGGRRGEEGEVGVGGG